MKELLVPVGNMDSLMVAINAGADAVYLAGKKYGARASAVNFDDDEMVRAIKLCHLFDVKIYVTVNTLIYESEFESVFNYVCFLYENGVDAIIVQDLGLISYLKKYLPDLEIHASTQVHNSNDETLKFLADLGVKRVVLARELSIDEINDMSTDIELEAFIHGAICVSFSGQCLFSSCILNRSGNRGECAQMCRLPYKLYKDDEEILTDGSYLISPKELNTSSSFDKIMDSKVYSLKIEGRLKSPEYVGCVTKLYRDLIDQYEKNRTCHVDEETLHDLSVIFNREFTEGFILNTNGLMNIKTSNHQGLLVGEVISLDKKYVKIKLFDDISQGDGIRFTRINEGMILNYIYDLRSNLISGAKSGECILVDNRFDLNVGDKVNRTFSVAIREKYLNLEEKKIPVHLSFSAHAGDALKLTISDGVNLVTREFGTCEIAKTSKTTDERIKMQLSKLGNTPFKVAGIDLEIGDNLFINIKDINEVRRMVIQELIKLREGKTRKVCLQNVEEPNDFVYDDKMSISILVRNEEQLKYLLDKMVRIYVPDKKLYLKYKDYENVYYRVNRVKDNFGCSSLVTNLGSLKNGGISDYFLNASNHHSIDLLSKYADIVTLSIELSDEDTKSIMKHYNYKKNVEVFLYGRVELMLMKYCPLKYLVNKNEVCSVCAGGKYYLSDGNKKYPILTSIVNHTTHILNHEILNKIDKISFYKEIGIRNYRIELFDESIDDIKRILECVRSNYEN